MSSRITLIPVLLILASLPAGADAQSPLADLYRSGEVRLVPEVTITDADLPENVYLVGFEQPWSITVDDEGNIFFADYGANNIKKFDSSGRFIKVIGREGSGPGDLRTPYFLTYSQGRLVVWDMGNTRYCLLTQEGDFISARPLNRSEEGWPGKLQTLPNGDIVTQASRTIPGPDGNEPITEIRLYSPTMEYKRTILVQVFRANADRDYGSFDAFTASGEFLGTVEITEGGDYPLVGSPIFRDFMIVGEQGEFGEISLIKYRLSK